MKDYLLSIFRHAITAVPAFGAGAAAHGWLTPEEGAAVDAELVKFLTVMAAIAAAAAARGLMWLVAKYVPHLSGFLGGASSGGTSPAWVLMLVSTAAALTLVGGLSSCSTEQLAAFKSIPLTVGIEGEHGTYSYNHETGIGVAVKVRQEKKANIEHRTSNFERRMAEAFALWNPRRPYRPQAMCLEEVARPDFDLRSLVHQREGGWPFQGTGPVISPANLPSVGSSKF